MQSSSKRFRGLSLSREAFLRPERLLLGALLPRAEHGSRRGRLAHLDRFLAREFVRHYALASESPLRVLDVGCAPGTRGSVTTLELKKAFEKAGARVEAHGLDKVTPFESQAHSVRGVTYHRADVVFSRGLPSGSFDLIRAVNVLPYVEDAASALANIVARLRPGGLFLADSLFEAPGVFLMQKNSEGRLNLLGVLPSESRMRPSVLTRGVGGNAVEARLSALAHNVGAHKGLVDYSRLKEGGLGIRGNGLKAARDFFVSSRK